MSYQIKPRPLSPASNVAFIEKPVRGRYRPGVWHRRPAPYWDRKHEILDIVKVLERIDENTPDR